MGKTNPFNSTPHLFSSHEVHLIERTTEEQRLGNLCKTTQLDVGKTRV